MLYLLVNNHTLDELIFSCLEHSADKTSEKDITAALNKLDEEGSVVCKRYGFEIEVRRTRDGANKFRQLRPRFPQYVDLFSKPVPSGQPVTISNALPFFQNK